MIRLYILRFFHLRLGEILALSISSHHMSAIRKQESSITLDNFYPVTGQIYQLCFEYSSQAISDSESFLLCEHFPYIIRESVADSRFSFTYVTLGTQGFRPYPNNFFLAITDILSEYIHAHRFQSRCGKLFYIYGIFILSFQH